MLLRLLNDSDSKQSCRCMQYWLRVVWVGESRLSSWWGELKFSRSLISRLSWVANFTAKSSESLPARFRRGRRVVSEGEQVTVRGDMFSLTFKVQDLNQRCREEMWCMVKLISQKISGQMEFRVGWLGFLHHDQNGFIISPPFSECSLSWSTFPAYQSPDLYPRSNEGVLLFALHRWSTSQRPRFWFALHLL